MSAEIEFKSPEDMTKLEAQVAEGVTMIARLKKEMTLAVVGQSSLIDSLLIGLLSDGHVLVEGVPGLAKTTIIKHLTECVQAEFQRIQFTPDLLPADVVGTQIYSQKTGEFTTRKGPVFTNILLADEINRCPPKVQSALLEAMQEHQVTLGEATHHLPEPFLVMATENPVESEGTYPLPEAQVDRFMIKAYIDYPTANEELEILEFIANVEGGEGLRVFEGSSVCDSGGYQGVGAVYFGASYFDDVRGRRRGHLELRHRKRNYRNGSSSVGILD